MAPEYRLFVDHYNVIHWRYPFTGILFLCGNEQFYNGTGRTLAEGFPTCLRCIVVLARDEER